MNDAQKKDAEEQTAEEVEEQGARVRFHEDEKPDDTDDSDGEADVEEQMRRFSDASLKRSVEPVKAPLSILS